MNKPKINYILNDLAFSNLRTRCLYTECTEQDIVEFENQLNLKEQELQRKDNIISELKKWLNEPQITYNLDATEFGIEKIECVSVKDTLDKIKELESK